MKMYWPMAKQNNGELLSTYSAELFEIEARNVIDNWSKNYILADKWIDVYEDDNKVETIQI